MQLQKSEYLSDIWKDGIFANKVIFCTGGAGTICSAQVRAMVYLGANACIIGRNIEKTESAAKEFATIRPDASVIGIGAVDVRDFEALKAAVYRCVMELGSIDFVILGAAGNFVASIEQLSVNAFKSVMDINVLGSYNTIKATLPYLVESAQKHMPGPETLSGTGGRIIFLGATLHYRGMPLQSHACAAKAALDSLSHCVAIEYGPRGVTSNIIAPGPVAATEGLKRLLPSDAEAKYTKSQPLGRLGHVRDVADATVYLLSEAGSYVTGQTLVVDGANWRTSGGMSTYGNIPYPDIVLSDGENAKIAGRRSK